MFTIPKISLNNQISPLFTKEASLQENSCQGVNFYVTLHFNGTSGQDVAANPST
jgi:hypothetical protein